MKEEVRKYRMDKYGTITWCEERNTMCFGCLTENGSCKHITCLHDDPEWQAQQDRIEERRQKAMEESRIQKAVIEPEEKAVKTPKQIEIDKLWRMIRDSEVKAEALYRAYEKKEADRLMNKAKRARRRLWEIEHR